MRTPLLTVIIPTHKRPQYLPRAIESALTSSPEGDAEVIVVPNGQDDSWKAVAERFAKDARIHWHPIEIAHANAARNHGLALARGKYVRFLDDDDFLHAERAAAQLEELIDHKAEISSGRVQHVSVDMTTLDIVAFSDASDFVVAAVSSRGISLPTANVFLTEGVRSVSWNECVPRAQDYVWMIDLAAFREWDWISFDDAVGGWQHHSAERVSSTSARQGIQTWIVDSLLKLYEALATSSRITAEREKAIATELWNFAHNYFPRFPSYSCSVARKARAIHQDSRPRLEQRKTSRLASHVDPLLWEWVVLPKRYANHCARLLRETLFGTPVIRRL